MAEPTRLSLFDLLLLPLVGPLRGLWFVLDKLREAAEQEAESAEKLWDRLLELQLAYELGEVPEDEYRQLWTAVREQLEALTASTAEPEEEGDEVM